MSGLHAELAVHRGDFTLDVELTVPSGEVLAVLGPNGSGKSTLLALLAGVLSPDRGHITLDGRPLTDVSTRVAVPPHRRGTGLLAQQSLLFPHLDVRENVAFGPRVTGTPRKRARALADEWLDRVDATGLAAYRPGQLSGGQAQRAAVARALAARPHLLLLDEPMAALDIDSAPAVRGLLHGVLREPRSGRDWNDAVETPARPAVLVTHDVLDALVLADRVVVLGEGHIVESGPTRHVLESPRTAFTARLAGLNLVHGVAVEEGLRVGAAGGVAGLRGRTAEITVLGRVSEDVVTGAPAVAVFQPSAVAVHRERPAGSPRDAFEVHLTGLEPRGDTVRVVAERVDDPSAGPLAADVTPAAVAELDLRPGQPAWFVVKATAVAVHPVADG